MAGRIRSIKPELLEDTKMRALSDAAWRLFVSTWLLADDYGNFRADARYLAAMVWQDTARAHDAGSALAELVQAGRVTIYHVEGEQYASVRNWSRHQRVDNAGKARVPQPPAAATPPTTSGTGNPTHAPESSANLREPPRTSASTNGDPTESPPDLRPPTSEKEVEGSPATPPRATRPRPRAPAAGPPVSDGARVREALTVLVSSGEVDPRVPAIAECVVDHPQMRPVHHDARGVAEYLIGPNLIGGPSAKQVCDTIRERVIELETGSTEKAIRARLRWWATDLAKLDGNTSALSTIQHPPVFERDDTPAPAPGVAASGAAAAARAAGGRS